jgi:hypothetical protein
MPEDGQAWRDTLRWLDEDARALHPGRGFAHLVRSEQGALIQGVQDHADAGEQWHDWSATHTWSLWTRYACTAFYSHPWAWNEIGFPGPAYPRGYLNAGVDAREHWERAEVRGTDPVPFAERAEQARREHTRLVEREGAP